MKNKFPVIEALLREAQTEKVTAFTVDDILKSIKRFEELLRKVELSIAKGPPDFHRAGEQTAILKDVRRSIMNLNTRLDRLLGIGL